MCDDFSSPAPPCPGDPPTTSDHDFLRCLWFLSLSLLSVSLFLLFLFSQLHLKSMTPLRLADDVYPDASPLSPFPESSPEVRRWGHLRLDPAAGPLADDELALRQWGHRRFRSPVSELWPFLKCWIIKMIKLTFLHEIYCSTPRWESLRSVGTSIFFLSTLVIEKVVIIVYSFWDGSEIFIKACVLSNLERKQPEQHCCVDAVCMWKWN